MSVNPADYAREFEAYKLICTAPARVDTEAELARLRRVKHHQELKFEELRKKLRGEWVPRRKRHGLMNVLVRSSGSSLGQQIWTLRRKYDGTISQIDRLERMLESDDYIIANMADEFARICRIPQVYKLRVDKHGTLFVMVQARIMHEGRCYDLGDWQIPLHRDPELKPDDDMAGSIREIRSGLLKPKNMFDGIYYRLSEGLFCLGVNYEVVEDYAIRRQYVAAIEIAIYALCSVNEGHEPFIPTHLKPVTEGTSRVAA